MIAKSMKFSTKAPGGVVCRGHGNQTRICFVLRRKGVEGCVLRALEGSSPSRWREMKGWVNHTEPKYPPPTRTFTSLTFTFFSKIAETLMNKILWDINKRRAMSWWNRNHGLVYSCLFKSKHQTHWLSIHETPQRKVPHVWYCVWIWHSSL